MIARAVGCSAAPTAAAFHDQFGADVPAAHAAPMAATQQPATRAAVAQATSILRKALNSA